MKTLLHIDSSARSAYSVSRELSAEQAWFAAPARRDAAQAPAISRWDQLIDELIAADVIVNGTHAHNPDHERSYPAIGRTLRTNA